MKAIIRSNNSFPKEYEGIKTRSALVAAKALGRCEFGEVIEIRTNKGKLIDMACWSVESQEYYRAYIG